MEDKLLSDTRLSMIAEEQDYNIKLLTQGNIQHWHPGAERIKGYSKITRTTIFIINGWSKKSCRRCCGGEGICAGCIVFPVKRKINRPNASRPDLPDINMPNMNGWEFIDAYSKLGKELQ